jgi:hypothetical protein
MFPLKTLAAFKRYRVLLIALLAIGLILPAVAATGPADTTRLYLPLVVRPPAGLLRIHTVFDNGAGGAGESTGAGVIVRLNGREIGVTDASGLLTSSQPAGAYTLEGVLPSLAIGSAAVTLAGGQTLDLTLVLDGNGEVVEPAELRLAELVNGALSLESPSVTLRLFKDGAPLAVTTLMEVELGSINPNFQPIDMTELFTLTPAGALQAIDPAAVISSFQTDTSSLWLRVNAQDGRGFSYDEAVSFVPGLYAVDVQLAPPPSQPGLPVAGLAAQVAFGQDPAQTMTADAQGWLHLTNVPGSMLSVSSTTQSGANTYSGAAEIAIDGPKQLRVFLLGNADIINGAPAWELITPELDSARPARQPDRRTAPPATTQQLPEAPAAPGAAPIEVTVTAAGENVPVSASQTLTVAKGTKKVTLKYTVTTAEYPEYVIPQSRYNDTWRLSVLASTGAQLFSINRGVNSQLYSPPTWNSAGSTGELQQSIDVSALAAAGDIKLTLAAMTTNIGDDILPTTVHATLGAEESIVINTITRDTVTPTAGASDRFSIPRPGQTNTYRRKFDLTFTKPDDVTLSNVKAELLDESGGVLQTILDEAPGTPRLQVLSPTKVRVEVTFNSVTSQVGSTPPPTNQIRYRFTIKGRKSGGSELTSEPKESAAFFGLWRMPDGIARYGARDAGLDDWASQHAYDWLDANRALVTRVDDISGEHARNIGHQTHAEGRDIDMFHVYTFPNGAASGTINYLRMTDNVRSALGGNAQARAHVSAWVTQTRARFDSFIDDPEVERIYYAIGSAVGAPGIALGDGWARALLRTGTYTAPGGQTLNLGVGAWANANDAKLRFNAVHNNHFHVALVP